MYENDIVPVDLRKREEEEKQKRQEEESRPLPRLTDPWPLPGASVLPVPPTPSPLSLPNPFPASARAEEHLDEPIPEPAITQRADETGPSNRPTLRERLENHLGWVLLGVAAASFGVGFKFRDILDEVVARREATRAAIAGACNYGRSTDHPERAGGAYRPRARKGTTRASRDMVTLSFPTSAQSFCHSISE